MSSKSIVMLCFVIGSSFGSYVPVLFGVGVLTFTSVILGAVGGVAGIVIGYKISS